MSGRFELPDGLEHGRTTDVFDEQHHPRGLLRAHRVAEGVWARLLVHTGSLTFVFDDQPKQPIEVAAGADLVIPPSLPHHVEIDGPVTFAIEFHRSPTGAPSHDPESTGLLP
ncbi:MAG TPA: DUF1971 domain-containing protein [Ilumatobacter sp.]|nr:DUF1971 domain-containing protein [Ilumatobacter sp.]